ncbi:hypothetical protein [Neoroseomonas soli]|uniref:Uncharacterized protein n=1 Tax=Neoroseomonas soli TaxID=1081025 RepID=A0A9X9X0H2_9PROT|nr:hypothetical protein [Neoroseomonas soli]MBR0672901.1 hypothetical protein [Neoroseomonas soli]
MTRADLLAIAEDIEAVAMPLIRPDPQTEQERTNARIAEALLAIVARLRGRSVEIPPDSP